VAEDRTTLNGGLGPRWTEGPLVGRAHEAEAIELFRAATSLPGFSAVSSQRVWRRLGAPRPARRWLRPAVIVGALVAAGAATAASLAVMRTLSRPAAPRLSSPAATVRRGLARPAESFAPEPLVIRAADGPAPSPKASAKRPAHAKRTRATAAAQRTPLAEDPGTLGKETTLFREALSLRAARDPRAAIAVLDRYAALYPRGSYAAEVIVLRGELAADAGDCRSAISSFNRALVAPASPGLEERALYGRAACRQRMGEKGARGDFERYLERFPTGRWSQHAKAFLLP
jgi:TolA-binding protein